MTALEWVQRRKLMVIARGMKPERMLALADALYTGGIDLMEVPFAQDRPETWADTARTIQTLCDHVEGKMLIGAGTVLTREQLKLARDAGAAYIVAPNAKPEMIREVKKYGLCSFPGAFTASEIVEAFEAGADAVKVFPAGSLGPSYLKALKAPLAHIPLLAFGGITEENVADYIEAGCCGVGVGGRVVNQAWIEAGEWDKITAMAAAFRRAVGE